MRRALPVAALAFLPLLACGVGMQQAPNAAPLHATATTSGNACASTAQEAERQLVALEEEWNRAGTAGDAAFFERVLADDFVATGGRTVRSRAAYIDGVRDTTSGPRTRAALSETRVRVYGDAAVVSGVASYAGAPPVRRRYTEVFVCRDGQWHAVHGHYSRLPDAAGQ